MITNPNLDVDITTAFNTKYPNQLKTRHSPKYKSGNIYIIQFTSRSNPRVSSRLVLPFRSNQTSCCRAIPTRMPCSLFTLTLFLTLSPGRKNEGTTPETDTNYFSFLQRVNQSHAENYLIPLPSCVIGTIYNLNTI